MSRHPDFDSLYVHENDDGTFDILDEDGEVVEEGFDTNKAAEKRIKRMEDDYNDCLTGAEEAARDRDEYFDNLPGGRADYAYDPFRGS